MSRTTFWEGLDLHAISPQVYVFGKDSYSTRWSIIVSIVSYMAIIILSGYFAAGLLERQSMIVIYNQDSQIYPVLNISSLPFMIGLFDNDGKPYKNADRTFNFNAMFSKFDYYTNSTGDRLSISSVTSIPLEKCDKNKHFGNFTSYFSDIIYMSNFYCITPDRHNLTIYGIFGDGTRNFSNLVINTNRCVNNSRTSNRSDCLDQKTIDTALESVYFTMNYLDYDINHNNVDSPQTLVRKSDSILLSSKIYTRIADYKKVVYYDTDYGYLFEDYKRVNFFQEERQDKSYDYRVDDITGTFSTMVIRNSRKVDIYKRSFMKLQQMIASIGGIIQGILTAGYVIVMVFSRKLLFLSIIINRQNNSDPSPSSENNAKKEISISRQPLTQLNNNK